MNGVTRGTTGRTRSSLRRPRQDIRYRKLHALPRWAMLKTVTI